MTIIMAILVLCDFFFFFIFVAIIFIAIIFSLYSSPLLLGVGVMMTHHSCTLMFVAMLMINLSRQVTVPNYVRLALINLLISSTLPLLLLIFLLFIYTN